MHGCPATESITFHLRIARPVADLARTEEMYCRGLGLRVIGHFQDHDGFDGVIVGAPGAIYHFEFTHSRSQPVHPSPTVEDLIVLYVPAQQDWLAMCARMPVAGFKQLRSFNPYWEERGRTYEDRDGYRVVLQQAEWPDGETSC